MSQQATSQLVRMVVARYREPLEWLLQVPSPFEIVVINKGEEIEDSRIRKRVSAIVKRPNVGREADSYLAFIAAGGMSGATHVVFTQGDPFSHSPELLGLLEHVHLWLPIQPLSICWQTEWNVPPESLLRRFELPSIKGIRYRTEIFSLASLAPISFWDAGVGIIHQEYLRVHGLSAGEPILPHFLKACGLDRLHAAADRAVLGEFCYGGIFGVQPAAVETLTQAEAESLLSFTGDHGIHPYIFERAWLHLFGHPFVEIHTRRFF